jgi:GT2 family glycosyltransferase
LGQERNTIKSDRGAIRLSVVSHEQDELVSQLFRSVARYCPTRKLTATVVRNTSFSSGFDYGHFPFPVHVIQNVTPKGFAANHNQVLATCEEEFCCVLNPDIILTCDPFDRLLHCLSDKGVGVVAPMLTDSDGNVQDSARRFPTPWRISRRIFFKKVGECNLITADAPPFAPDWVAGMFMLFPTAVLREIGGFDERFYMYCEDADICMRLSRAGYKSYLVPEVKAIHNARRESHRSIRYLRWHTMSLLRFFKKYPLGK